MKRVAGALLALLWAFPAFAVTPLLVVSDRTIMSGGLAVANQRRQDAADLRTDAYAQQLLDKTVGRGNYKFVPPGVAKTEYCGSGLVVYPNGATESFYAVLHLNFNGTTLGQYPGYAPESLTVGGATYSHSVPQLYWLIESGNGIASNVFFADTADAETTGTTSGAGGLRNQLGTLSAQWTWEALDPRNPTRPWQTTSYNHATLKNTPPAGGFRSFVDATRDHGLGPAADAMFNNDNNTQFAPAWFDSTQFVETDSTMLWERPMAHISGAKPLIFARVYGSSDCRDSVNANNKVPCEFDPGIALMSLAVLDSAAGGTILSKDLLPIKLGVVVAGGFNRSSYVHPGGIAPNDTTALKASLDSLAAQVPAIPITVAADMDSVGSYPSEKGWWQKLPRVKFSPMTRAGVDTAVAGGGTHRCRPVDAYGLYRTRIAVGDGSFLGADTAAIYSHVRRLFYKADSTFGVDYVSHFLTAPLDDFSAENMAVSIDSTLYAATLAGARGFLIDGQEQQLNGTNPRSYNFGGQRMYRALGKDVPLLAHSGFRICGSKYLFDVRQDSTVSQSTQYPIPSSQGSSNGEQFIEPDLVTYECHRAMSALLFNEYRDFDIMPHQWPDAWDGVVTSVNDRIYALKHASVFRMSANDFGSGYANGNATRPGYWTLKSLNNYMFCLNKMANRTVMCFDWPENIKP